MPIPLLFSVLRLCAAFLLFLGPAHAAFSFTSDNNPTSCGDFTVTWNGGSAPFHLALVPLFGTPRNVSVPSSAVSNGKGTFSTKLLFPQGQKFVATMSDSSCFASGGTSQLLTTGASKGGTCTTKDPGVDFSFQANSQLQQCRPYTFSNFDKAIQPVTAIGIIPGGQSFANQLSNGANTFDWIANSAKGTSMIFMMIDSQGRQGGASDLKVVGDSGDSSCLNNALSSTLGLSSTTVPTSGPASSKGAGATSANPTQTSAGSSSSSGGSSNAGVIAGAVVGVLVFLAAAVALLLFYIRRRREGQRPWDHGGGPFSRRQSNFLGGEYGSPYNPPYSNVSVTTPASSAFHDPDRQYTANPFSDPPSPYTNGMQTEQINQQHLMALQAQPSVSNPKNEMSQSQPPFPVLKAADPFNPPNGHTSSAPSAPDPFNPVTSTSVLTPAQRKAAEAAKETPRFVLHNDAEDAEELPPQYIDRRSERSASPDRTSLAYARSSMAYDAYMEEPAQRSL